MKLISIPVLSVFLFCSTAYGTQQFTAQQHQEQLKSASTAKGKYAQYDRWPQDYFLIPQNLPFMVGILLYHPGSKDIELSKGQREKIHIIRNQTVPAVLKLAGSIKDKELELAQKLVVQQKKPQKLEGLVDEIATLRATLTKAHMVCIQEVQDVLDDKQYAALLRVAETVGHPKKKDKRECN